MEVFLPSDDEGMVMTQAKKMRHGESTASKTKERAAVEEDLPSDDGSMVISNPNIKSKVSLKKKPKLTHSASFREKVGREGQEALLHIEFQARHGLLPSPERYHDFAEIFSPPRLVPLFVERHLKAEVSQDILTGWDLEKRNTTTFPIAACTYQTKDNNAFATLHSVFKPHEYEQR